MNLAYFPGVGETDYPSCPRHVWKPVFGAVTETYFAVKGKIQSDVNSGRSLDSLTGKAEEYIGAVSSARFMKKGKHGLWGQGYEICVTSQRIVGIRSRRFLLVLALYSSFVGLLFLLDFFLLGPNLPSALYIMYLAFAASIGLSPARLSDWTLRRQKPRPLSELDHVKDFEVRRDSMSCVELKNPTSGEAGYISFVRKDGTEQRVTITGTTQFERLRSIIKEFSSNPPQIPTREILMF